ncbi:MAG: HD-GYP domain-containing protein [Pirellulaceae bacterium]|jgi:HD-GYP domain-containing protein (c-di-GMP phosphodiesterase class II)|nr:HD-GYP domain-containing protein [Pirellulaceae bacterium]
MAGPSLQSQGYLPVATATLFPATEIRCDLYLQRVGQAIELYRSHQYPLEVADLERLKQHGIDHVYIRTGDADIYRQYLCQQVLHEESVPTEVRITALREVTRVAFQDAMDANDPYQAADLASDLGREIASLIADQAVALQEVFHILEHDYYTFTHVCNVSTYCVMLARDLGYSQEHELASVATGALLHDIGKRHVPAEILNKPAKPTAEEWAIIRKHPVSGYQELSKRSDLSWGQLMMVYQHHERLDGSGYPSGATGDDIHPWAKVCAVVDVFDALTCSRPYRQPVPSGEVCDYLQQHTGTWFDREVVACWAQQVRNIG